MHAGTRPRTPTTCIQYIIIHIVPSYRRRTSTINWISRKVREYNRKKNTKIPIDTLYYYYYYLRSFCKADPPLPKKLNADSRTMTESSFMRRPLSSRLLAWWTRKRPNIRTSNRTACSTLSKPGNKGKRKKKKKKRGGGRNDGEKMMEKRNEKKNSVNDDEGCVRASSNR